MQDFSSTDCKIEVEQGRVVVNMGGNHEKEAAGAAASTAAAISSLSEKPVAKEAVIEGIRFYIAKNSAGEIERCVSSTIADRATVAHLVASWIAEGFLVESAGIKEMKKLVNAMDKAEREREAAAKAEKESFDALHEIKEAPVESPQEKLVTPRPAPAPAALHEPEDSDIEQARSEDPFESFDFDDKGDFAG